MVHLTPWTHLLHQEMNFSLSMCNIEQTAWSLIEGKNTCWYVRQSVHCHNKANRHYFYETTDVSGSVYATVGYGSKSFSLHLVTDLQLSMLVTCNYNLPIWIHKVINVARNSYKISPELWSTTSFASSKLLRKLFRCYFPWKGKIIHYNESLMRWKRGVTTTFFPLRFHHQNFWGDY